MTVPTEVHGTEDRQDADAVFRIHRETIDEAAEVVDNKASSTRSTASKTGYEASKPEMKPLNRMYVS